MADDAVAPPPVTTTTNMQFHIGAAGYRLHVVQVGGSHSSVLDNDSWAVNGTDEQSDTTYFLGLGYKVIFNCTRNADGAWCSDIAAPVVDLVINTFTCQITQAGLTEANAGAGTHWAFYVYGIDTNNDGYIDSAIQVMNAAGTDVCTAP